jgi:hypothetical protein
MTLWGFGSDAFGESSGSKGFDSDSAGDDTFGDSSSDTFGLDSGFGGGYDSYGFSDFASGGACGCYPKKEELVDMDELARLLYDLLRREAFVERERIGIR